MHPISFVKGFAFLSILVLLPAVSCNRKKENQKQAPPAAETPAPIGNQEKMVQGPQSEGGGMTNKAVAFTGQEELNCENICGHMAFCNRKVHDKNTSVTAFSACVKGCGQRKSTADRSRWEAMEECLKQHPGEACGELRTCIERRYEEIQKHLHLTDDKEANTP